MKRVKNAKLCPMCGSQKNVRTKRSRTNVRAGLTSVFKQSPAETELLKAESSDDKTASSFAALLLETKKARDGI